jgi:predicted MFS family arabinose efflux permease
MGQDRIVSTVFMLGAAQTITWASSYYLPAILATPIARDLGVDTSSVFAAFSLALLVSALLGPFAGRSIDRWGGRKVLPCSNLIFAAGLFTLAFAHGSVGLTAAWVIIGIAMGSGLYEAAFATLVRLYGHDARNGITGITLIAGFASTLGWPLSTFLEAQVGWRGACLAWAALHIAVGLPLNVFLPSIDAVALLKPDGEHVHVEKHQHDPPRNTNMLPAAMLAFVFAATWFVSTAMAAHLPRLLMLEGVTLAAAVTAGALVGPAQVGGRLLEFGLLRRVHPLLSARLAAIAHPIGVAVLLTTGAPLAFAFVILHGAGNGILTIAIGTLPLALFGPHDYGRRQGILMVPARITQALAPLLFGLCLNRWGGRALWLSGALGLLAVAVLLMLPTAIRHSEAASQSNRSDNGTT